jgi:hypothetical protein
MSVHIDRSIKIYNFLTKICKKTISSYDKIWFKLQREAFMAGKNKVFIHYILLYAIYYWLQLMSKWTYLEFFYSYVFHFETKSWLPFLDKADPNNGTQKQNGSRGVLSTSKSVSNRRVIRAMHFAIDKRQCKKLKCNIVQQLPKTNVAQPRHRARSPPLPVAP